MNQKRVITALMALLVYLFLYVSRIDAYAYLWLKPYKTGLLRYLFSFISTLGRGEVLVFFVVLLCLLPKVHLNRREVFWRGVLTLIVAGIVCLLIKVLLGRPRPSLLLSGHYWPHGPSLTNDFFSTPSGHTVEAFALASLFSSWFRKWKPLLMGMALLIGISRVFLLYHYPSDIVVSIYLGSTIGEWMAGLRLPRFARRHVEE